MRECSFLLLTNGIHFSWGTKNVLHIRCNNSILTSSHVQNGWLGTTPGLWRYSSNGGSKSITSNLQSRSLKSKVSRSTWWYLVWYRFKQTNMINIYRHKTVMCISMFFSRSIVNPAYFAQFLYTFIHVLKLYISKYYWSCVWLTRDCD